MRSTVFGILVNLVLVCVKGAAGVIGHSYALTADAIESGADVFSSLIVWYGLKIAGKAPDHNHPYGHGKAEPLAAAAVGFFLALAAGVIATESIRNILTPHRNPESFTLWVLSGTVGIKVVIFMYTHKTGKNIGSTAVKADAMHHFSDALTSLMAFFGISIALIGGAGYESADDWAALAASGVILYNSWKTIWPALREIMDEAPDKDTEKVVRQVAAHVPGVIDLEKCFVRKSGLDFYVDLHVHVNGSITVYEGHDIAHRVKEAVMAAQGNIRDVLVHVEPAE
ncbi:MAG: cation diffusion facilitator family transporter [Bacteroidota bacterium]